MKIKPLTVASESVEVLNGESFDVCFFPDAFPKLSKENIRLMRMINKNEPFFLLISMSESEPEKKSKYYILARA